MTDTLASPAPVKASPFHELEVLWVRHWTDQLFSFGVARPEDFRFRSGEFVMIGLPGEDGAKPVLRAYSIASPCWDEQLEFFSIKAPNGPLTTRLQKIQAGDTVLMGKKPTGTLVLDALTGGERLWLIGTGTGLAPWLSVARDPDTYSRFGRVIVCHTVRGVADLAYRDFFTSGIHDDPLVGDEAKAQLTYYPTVTREDFETPGRITDRIKSGAAFADLGIEGSFDPAKDRVMLCGSMGMIKETGELLETFGLKEGSNAEPGDYVLERAFVG
ncbi:ferredoxin-NADP reductase [Brevundimonas sp. Leaf363]|uniref:ferredoxin--NADP reductase n=1 Tax=Brevundimonas sp. Leaf363 TaxID=1736353 RepID=UPI0006F49463|nr:ferredoxin--NADP reductase [Brevundimonas sp. Leaf363]KQS54269.1 ferredoxin-NADP reductase [Brevundimonas sp. Leaf363]